MIHRNRAQIAKEEEERYDQLPEAEKSKAKPPIKPLRLIIMSATLRVEDFTLNTKMFPKPPPVIRVDARQHPVSLHFNKRTALGEDYVQEAFRKTCKIHRRLPDGGILVFLTGKAEILHLCRLLRKEFGMKRRRKGKQKSCIRGGWADTTGESRESEAVDGDFMAREVDDDEEDAELMQMPDSKPDDYEGDSSNWSDADDSSDADEKEAGDTAPATLSTVLSTDKTSKQAVSDLPRETISKGDGGDDERSNEYSALPAAPAAVGPVHVLPLFAMLTPKEQSLVFQPPPPGHRLIVVATNVAETSLTIPGIKYVVDSGRVKQRIYDVNTSMAQFSVRWVSQASADQRAGRAGRTGM